MAKTTKYILLIISILIYTFINNFLDRSEFTFLIFGIIIVGFIYFYFLKNNNFTVREIIISAVLFRVVLLFSTPNFSDDYFRFIWDGQILTQSENPYLFLPKEELNNSLITELKIDKEIYKGLNSKNYYTVYPPLNQFVFGGSSYFSGSNFSLNILFLKLFILLFEIATLFILFKFLRMLKLKQNLAIIYAFNPLVVIELVGNVHFEGMMLFLLLFSFYYLYKNKVILASILFGLAVSTKLIPLILLPLLLRYIGLKKSVIFYLIVGFVNIILMLPFLSHTFINNFSSSIDLYFQSFEFNASIYYIFRQIGYWITGYNQIGLIGKITPIIVVAITLYISFKNINLKKFSENKITFDFEGFIKKAGFILFCYYIFSSIVHPWYLINLVFISIFIKNRVYLIWSITVFLSYFAYSNYMNINYPNYSYHESSLYYFVVFFEYLSLLIYLIYFKKRNKIKLA